MKDLVESTPIGQSMLQEHLPAFMFDIQLMTLQLWQWLGLVVLLLAAWMLSWIVGEIVHRLLKPIAARTETHLDDRMLGAMRSPLRLLAAVGLFALGTALLDLSPTSYNVLGRVELALIIVAAGWLGLRAVDLLVETARKRFEERQHPAAVSLLPLGGKTAKAFLMAIMLLAILQNLGFHVTGLLAGLGVGGIAVALAAQKTIANLFGGVSLIADQPVRVGDLCKFGDKSGTIEEIGLRSTRVRTFDRTLVSVPNSEFSEMQLENYASRDRIRLLTTIGLRYETSPDQLRHVLAEMRKLLIAHPKITDTPARVRFIGFGAFSLDLELTAYVPTNDWNEFLQVREDVYLRIMDIVAASGSGFAFPSQTLYLGRDGGLDSESARRAEEQIGAWRQRNELPFPEFEPQTVAELDNTLDYPPRGSVASRDATR